MNHLLNITRNGLPPVNVRPNADLLTTGLIGIAIILFVAFVFWHYNRKEEKRRTATMIKPSPIAKAYGEIYNKIQGANKKQLRELEHDSIQFKISFSYHSYVDDLYNNLIEELREKRYFLTLQYSKTETI